MILISLRNLLIYTSGTEISHILENIFSQLFVCYKPLC